MAPDELLRDPLVVVGNLALPAQQQDVLGVAGRWVAVWGIRVDSATPHATRCSR